MALTVGRLALDNGFYGSIPGDWLAPPPQNIQDVYKRQAIMYADSYIQIAMGKGIRPYDAWQTMFTTCLLYTSYMMM